MENEKKNKRLCKIVYFDEESVTDYIQIIAGGKLEKTTELLDQTNDNGEAGVEAKAGIGIGKTLKLLLGFEVSASVQSALETSFNTQRMAKNILKNTILTDFIAVINDNAGVGESEQAEQGAIRKFVGYTITAPKDSLSYIALISPYFSMLRGGSTIPAGDLNIALEKLDNTIKEAKGYYEFVGSNEQHTVIFRFNIKSFKNNYKVTDLLRMNLCVYAIKVGESTLSALNFNKEFDVQTSIKDNPSYKRTDSATKASGSEDKLLSVYDVMLAGVEADD